MNLPKFLTDVKRNALLVVLLSASSTFVFGQQPGQQSEQKPISMAKINIHTLESCVGLNGKVTKPADIEKLNAVVAELKRRSTVNEGDAADAWFALGREAEHPSVAGVQPDYKAAIERYKALSRDSHDMRALYHLGNLAMNGLGMPRNNMGSTWMQKAVIHGYIPGQDRMETGAERQAESLSILQGIGAFATAVHDPSHKDGACYVDERYFDNESKTWQTRKKMADPHWCRKPGN
jgi:hypothetical protein